MSTHGELQMRRTRDLLAFFLVVQLLVCVQTSRGQDRLRIAYSAISGAMLTPWVGLEAGIFKKNGLDAQLIYIPGGSTAAAALAGGDVQVILASGDGVVRGRLQGLDLISFADMTSTLVFSLMARPEIATAAEIRGKKVGATRFGTSSYAALVAGLKHFGIQPNDTTVLQMGGMPQVLLGLQSGGIAAGILSPPNNIKAKKLGMKEFLDVGTLKIPFQMNTFIAKGEFTRKYPDTMRRLVRSIVESIHTIKTDQPATIKILQKYTHVDDPEILAETYRIFALKYLPTVPLPSEDAVKQRLAELSLEDDKARQANFKEFVDSRWVKELEENGFIARLYRP